MKITAVAIGTSGEVVPLVALASEMTKKEKGRTSWKPGISEKGN